MPVEDDMKDFVDDIDFDEDFDVDDVQVLTVLCHVSNNNTIFTAQCQRSFPSQVINRHTHWIDCTTEWPIIKCIFS